MRKGGEVKNVLPEQTSVKPEEESNILSTNYGCEIIYENAKTPYPADGIVYVSDVNDAYKIKTGKSIKKIDF